MTDKIIERYQEFWSMYSGDADFASQSKVLRGLITYVKAQYGDVSDHIELITEMSEELSRYLPLMDLDEFNASTKAVTYARRSIRTSGSITYASGLSRDISDEERKQLGESILEGDRSRNADINGEGDDSGNDLLDLYSDDDES